MLNRFTVSSLFLLNTLLHPYSGFATPPLTRGWNQVSGADSRSKSVEVVEILQKAGFPKDKTKSNSFTVLVHSPELVDLPQLNNCPVENAYLEIFIGVSDYDGVQFDFFIACNALHQKRLSTLRQFKAMGTVDEGIKRVLTFASEYTTKQLDVELHWQEGGRLEQIAMGALDQSREKECDKTTKIGSHTFSSYYKKCWEKLTLLTGNGAILKRFWIPRAEFFAGIIYWNEKYSFVTSADFDETDEPFCSGTDVLLRCRDNLDEAENLYLQYLASADHECGDSSKLLTEPNDINSFDWIKSQILKERLVPWIKDGMELEWRIRRDTVLPGKPYWYIIPICRKTMEAFFVVATKSGEISQVSNILPASRAFKAANQYEVNTVGFKLKYDSKNYVSWAENSDSKKLLVDNICNVAGFQGISNIGFVPNVFTFCDEVSTAIIIVAKRGEGNGELGAILVEYGKKFEVIIQVEGLNVVDNLTKTFLSALENLQQIPVPTPEPPFITPASKLGRLFQTIKLASSSVT